MDYSNYEKLQRVKRKIDNLKSFMEENLPERILENFDLKIPGIPGIWKGETIHIPEPDEIFNDIKDKIKTNISKPENKHLEAAFMSFMSGINDSINLANDDKFLDAYTEKYAAEGGENVGLLAQQCKKFFKENAREAQQQFGKLLDHFHELRNEPEYAADYKNNGNGIKPTSSNKLSVDNSLDRGCL